MESGHHHSIIKPAGLGSRSRLVAEISLDCDLAIAMVDPVIQAYQSALDLLAELSQDGSIPVNFGYRAAISSALEAVGNFIPLNAALRALTALKDDLDDFSEKWTERDVEHSKHQAIAAIKTLRHTAKLETVLRVQNRLSEDLLLDESNFCLTALGVTMTAMWSLTHEDQRDPDIPGVEFGMVPFVDISLDFLGRPQYNTPNGWVAASGDHPLARMPGSRWSALYHNTDTPFFEDIEHDSITYTTTHCARLMRNGVLSRYRSCARALGKAYQPTLTPQQEEVLNALAETTGYAFPIGPPSNVTIHTHDYDQEWVGSLAGLKNIAIQDHMGCYKFEFLSHLLRYAKDPSQPLGSFPMIQQHREVTYPVQRKLEL
ncbi:hypothetical protein RB595_005069 [Gaeumannomyces hyphopodioides]